MSGLRLTQRGRALVTTVALIAFLFMLGIAGWIEGGM